MKYKGLLDPFKHFHTTLESNSKWFKNLFLLLLLIVLVQDSHGQQTWGRWKRQLPPLEWNPWRNAIERFDKYVFSKKMDTYGEYVKGYSIPMYLEDTFWDVNMAEYPQWLLRRINCFLGVPYAEPPVGRYRFQRPLPPRWVGTHEATYYRPACPQRLQNILPDIPSFEKMNISEDCLYMNIFVPNRTTTPDVYDRNIYPVMVFIHSGNFSTGTSQAQPGHVLATWDVVVVNFNYRLGAFGFLTTEDEHAPGNFGMWDQVQALEFVKRNILSFRGDPTRVTLMGDGAGGVSVGLHLISPISYKNAYYSQVIMMSGNDLSMYGNSKPFYRPREYAMKLAKMVGCKDEDSYAVLKCLRNSEVVTWEMVVEAQHSVEPNDGVLGAVWAPIQDGLFHQVPTQAFLPETPDDLRREGQFHRVPCIIGINAHDGAEIANRTAGGLQGGISINQFRDFLDELVLKWKIIDVYRDRARDAIEFQYTHWADPSNTSARGMQYLDMVTDLNYGIGMDRIVKQQSDFSNTFMYVFNWKSWNDWLPWYLGVSHSAAIQYVLGYPFMNETILNETYMIPRQYYDYDDRNISDFMMYMWTSFAIYGDPTPNITRNVTWEPFNQYNFTYLEIRWYAHLWFRYRQTQYGFWNEYFPRMARQDYYYPTATPTPAAYQYVIATGCIGSLFILLLGAVAIVLYLMWTQHRAVENNKYRYKSYNEIQSASRQHIQARGLSESDLSGDERSAGPSMAALGAKSLFSTSSSNISRMTAAQYSEQCKRTAPTSHTVV